MAASAPGGAAAKQPPCPIGITTPDSRRWLGKLIDQRLGFAGLFAPAKLLEAVAGAGQDLQPVVTLAGGAHQLALAIDPVSAQTQRIGRRETNKGNYQIAPQQQRLQPEDSGLGNDWRKRIRHIESAAKRLKSKQEPALTKER